MYIYIYIWFRDVLVIFYFLIFYIQGLLCKSSRNRVYIYIYVDLSFLLKVLKVFRLQDLKNYVLSVVLTTRRFF